ncbi:hypothetical protein, partial [Pseudactinotalea sp.]|uniref:hypothetical protein n=1 Tax=Pseudactinotalea sp. TaxID=1926260 RepID=UPI003B3A03E5
RCRRCGTTRWRPTPNAPTPWCTCSITPEVFYVAADGHSQQVTHRSDGSVTVRIEGAIAEAFTALGLIGG